MSFEERGKALEDAFFANRNKELLADLKQDLDSKKQRSDLKEATGIEEDDMLDRVLALGINSESLVAMSIVPLVLVAWANGSVEQKERDAVLSGATKAGIEADSTARRLLQGWLEVQPDDALMTAWKDYTKTVCEKLQTGDRVRLCEQMVERSRIVAEAAGGFLGLGSISAKEQAVLDSLKAAFA